jgi:hypothetical protein
MKLFSMSKKKSEATNLDDVFSKVAIATDENEVTKKKRGRPAGLKAKK